MTYIEQNPKHKFKAGWYMMERNYGGYGRPVFRLIFTEGFAKKSQENANRLNNCDTVLEHFKEEPKDIGYFFNGKII